MKNDLTLKKSVSIKAPVSQVWDALTNPELIEQYFFGTRVFSDWKVGSPIIFKGVWQDKGYEDKGHILALEHEKLLTYDYWSNFSGTEDRPENYATITYSLETVNDETVFTITQNGFKDQKTIEHSEQNWGMVLNSLRQLLEK